MSSRARRQMLTALALAGASAGTACDSTLSLHAPWEGTLGALDEGCHNGTATACLGLARMYDEGTTDMARDPARAASYYRRACEAGVGGACGKLGSMLEHGDGIDKDPASAVAFYVRGCEAGDGSSCHDAAASFWRGGAVAKDPAKANALAEKACEKQQAVDCEWLADRLSSQAELARAASLYRKACEAEPSTSCEKLGVLLLEGRGVAKDESEAEGLFRRAFPVVERRCDEGAAPMCVLLATMFEKGYGRMADPARAHGLYARACEGGSGGACFAAGRLGEKLRGPEAGLASFERACELRIALGCVALADRLEAGRGVAADPARAATFRARACGLGDASGCKPAGVVDPRAPPAPR